MLSRAGLRDLAPRTGLLLMLAANGPDVDVLWSWFGGTANYLRHHRGFTHALAFSPLIALIPLAIVWAVERKRLPWARLWALSWIGVLSHLALDLTNVYGIRLYLPFSPGWPRLDTVNVVDLFIWALLLLGIIAPALGRLVSAEIGARPGRGTGWAVFVLIALLTYEAARYVMHDRAVRILESRIYNGAAPLRVAAFAQTANPFAWKGVVEMPDSYVIFQMNLREEFDPASGRVFYKAQWGPALEAARRTNDFDALAGFSSWPLWQAAPVPDPEGGQRVDLFDLRFGSPAAPGLSATAIIDAAGRVRQTAVGFGRIQPR